MQQVISNVSFYDGRKTKQANTVCRVDDDLARRIVLMGVGVLVDGSGVARSAIDTLERLRLGRDQVMGMDAGERKQALIDALPEE